MGLRTWIYLHHLPLHITPFPVNPWLQVQVKLPGLFIQAALVAQLSVSSLHSSISEECMGLLDLLHHLHHLPMHISPFPVYPWLQVQVKPPGVLVQAALRSQLSVSVLHSSISVNIIAP